MNHGTDSDILAFNAIDHDKVSARNDEFSGAFPSRPSEMREVSQPFYRCDEASNHSVSRLGVVEGNVVPNLVNLTPCFRGPSYPHQLGSS
jgi:hypothetical protein